jgi:copper oxidase (laccase) domain-containing protein
VPGAVLAVHTADCGGVLLWDASGRTGAVVGAAHAGWRGLEAGVLERTVAAMADLGAVAVSWQLGPCISGPEYEFGADDLDRLVDRYGPTLRTTTATGGPALDLRAGVRAALGAVGATEDRDGPDVCTATSDRHWSWRARQDTGRQASVIWFEGA